ncbi:MAG: DNA alkylation repair protein [Candidatus Pacebacteria bacterium]|nr:DNA alkylation repair protein [Candidatus Paceibacterota bacterium]
MSAQELIYTVKSFSDKKIANSSKRFFKTGKGEYGQDDIFLGIPVPRIRTIIRNHQKMSFKELRIVIVNPFHEIRLAGLLIVVLKAKQAHSVGERKKIFDWYTRHVKYVNNWDLVDATAEHIVGRYMSDMSGVERLVYIHKMIRSKNMWENRIIMIATLYEIRKGNCTLAVYVAEHLLTHSHDLIHKAVGWMLREVGKRDRALHIVFLNSYAKTMSRTTLRYAIEHFSPTQRKKYLGINKL